MKNNLNKILENSNIKNKDSFKSQNSNLLYKSYNITTNRIKPFDIINNKELSDIKSIVKNSVEKIYNLFNLQEMKENQKSSRKTNEIPQLRSTLSDIENINNTTIKKNHDNKKFIKADMNFKINNYLTVVNKNKNLPEGSIHVTLNNLEDEISYLHKKFKKNETKKNNLNTLNNIYNLKKSKNKDKKLKKNNSSNSNLIKIKNDIKNNIIMTSSKATKKSTISDNDYAFFNSKRFSPINFEENKYNIITNYSNNKNDEIVNNMTDKSIFVNTIYKKRDMNNNNDNHNYNNTIIPTRISHINKEEETMTMNNDGNINQSKETKINRDSINKSKNNSEKKKKYIFLKRTKNKKNNDDCEENKTKNIFSSQQKSKTKTNFHLLHSKVNNNNNSNGIKEEFLGDDPKVDNKNYDIDYLPETENDIKDKKTNLNININTKLDKKQNNYKKDKVKDIIVNKREKQNKYIQTTNKLVNINNILISGTNNTPKYLSPNFKSNNKLKVLKNKGLGKSNSYYLFLESDIKNNIFSRNKNRKTTSRINKDKIKINILNNRKIFNLKRKEYKSERNTTRKSLQTLYNTQFPTKTLTNDIIKLFLLLNEYIINNNILPDYNLDNNKDILNKLSLFLSKHSYVNYPREFDINIDNYINRVKKIQRCWRKYKIKQILGNNDEIHELKKNVFDKYIKKAGFKIKKIIGLFNSIIEDFNDIKNSEDINRMFYYIKNLIKRDLTTYEKNVLYKELINNYIYIK